MTEQEAKTKPCIGPCPTVTGRVVRGGKADGSDAYLCIGSACMAWRGQGNDPLLREPQGFCGLAGKP